VQKDWTFGSLYSRACSLSLSLVRDRGLKKGDRAILCFVPGLDFLVAFWACLSQGIVAVPVTPVDPFHPASDVAEKLAQIVASCKPNDKGFLTTTEYISALQAGQAYLEGTSAPAGAAAASSGRSAFSVHNVDWFCVDTVATTSFDPAAPFADAAGDASGHALAFLQYTSGSTGAPKGVMVGHAHIVANVAGCTETTRAGRSFDIYSHSVAFSWLPTFHDMYVATSVL
jgi:acyl-CoA synthetase (AMP-forming)/AMP-acid ligase II